MMLCLFIGNLNICRSLGHLEYKQNKKLSVKEQMITAFPDVGVEEITPECDFIVLACDGVWECKTNQEVCNFVAERLEKGINTSKIIEELFDSIVAADVQSGKKLL